MSKGPDPVLTSAIEAAIKAMHDAAYCIFYGNADQGTSEELDEVADKLDDALNIYRGEK